ncbi:hypothetical protein [Micromonospora psammae]|uniref:hypothetical protein n=1 Tax=Micromonospora sp. CPCC 205556 TaxID=3122398 RepID=UPI002FEEC8F2
MTAVAPGMVALRLVLNGQAAFVIAAQALDLPDVQIADQPPPVVPRPRTSPDVVPPQPPQATRAHPRCET